MAYLAVNGNKVLDSSNYSDYCTLANIGAAASNHTHTTINTSFVFNDSDIGEAATNLAYAASTHKINFYRNGLTIPYQMDNSNDGGIIRCRGTSESSCIFEMGTWDDSGSGETIQFNYYPTTSQVTPTYTVTVPKKTGTIALAGEAQPASDVSDWAKATSKPAYTYSEVGAAPSSHSHSDYIPIKTNGGVGSVGGGGNYGYCTLVTIQTNQAYINRPIHFEVSGRGIPVTNLEIMFVNTSDRDPSLSYFYTDNYTGFWIKKTDTYTWVIYGQYTEHWGSMFVHRLTGCGADLSIAFNLTNLSALPDGLTKVSSRVVLTSGSYTISGTLSAQSFKATSDLNLKENITKLGELDLSSISVYKYNFKDDPHKDSHIGLIAQEVQQVIPEAVSSVDGHLVLDYNTVLSVLLATVKSQGRKIIKLENQINESVRYSS